MTETVTIPKSTYEALMKDRGRLDFIESRRPYMVRFSGEKVKMTFAECKVRNATRYGRVRDCIDEVVADIRAEQNIYWVGEESEIYAARSLEELELAGFFTESEMNEIQRCELWGAISDSELDRVHTYIDTESGQKMEATLRELVANTYDFPDLILTAYGD